LKAQEFRFYSKQEEPKEEVLEAKLAMEVKICIVYEDIRTSSC
jgi:hypothetical protein